MTYYVLAIKNVLIFIALFLCPLALGVRIIVRYIGKEVTSKSRQYSVYHAFL